MSDGPISVTALLDEYIALIEEPREPDGKWHPSSYWGCDRKVIYEVRGTPQSNPPTARNKRVFRIGHIFHSFMQDAMVTSPDVLAVYPEFLIDSKLEETGHGDALVALLDGNYIVIEGKSINAKGFGFVKTGPKDDHAKQGSSYAVNARINGVWIDDDLGKGLGYGPGEFMPDGSKVPEIAPEGYSSARWIPALGDKLIGVLVVYFDKESFEIREHWLPYDEAWEQRIVDRLEHLETYRADPGSLPPRQKSKFGFPCSWGKGPTRGECSFFDKCWNEDGPGISPSSVEVEFEW